MRFALGVGILAIVQGCASQSVSIRSLPPEDPAAENAAAVESAAAFAAATKANGADTKADAALILAVHSLRLISVLVVGPFLVQFVGRWLAVE